MVKCIIESTAVLNKSILVRGDDNYSGAGADLDPQRVRGNMKRSVERMRRAAVKMLDTALREPREGEGQDALKLLLIAVVDTLQSAIVGQHAALMCTRTDCLYF
jgi:hypothetical protein